MTDVHAHRDARSDEPATGDKRGPSRVLVYSETAGWRHESIASGIAAVRALGGQHGFAVDEAHDGALFTTAGLAAYDAVVWMQVTGEVLTAEQRSAYEQYIRSGGGFVGVHAASDANRTWPFYGELVGAHFVTHPLTLQTARVRIEGPADPSTQDVPDPWRWHDEWYNFDRNPREDVTVLATVAEEDYEPGPGAMGADHPICWRHTVGAGHAWYTALGHAPESFADQTFLHHLLGGIRSAAGVLDSGLPA